MRRRCVPAAIAALAAVCGAALVAQPTPSAREGRQRAAAITGAAAALRSELRQSGGGDWEGWIRRLEPVRAELRTFTSGKSLMGRNGYVLDLHSLDYLLDTDLESGPEGTRPMDAIVAFDRRMKSLGIDFVYVPIPATEEVYPENFVSAVPRDLIIHPRARRFLLKLLEQDVEVVDLLRPFLAARDGYRLGLKKDDHWNNVEIEVAAGVVAARLRRYGFVPAAASAAGRFRTKAVTINGERGISAMNQVIAPSGELYDDVDRSPVLVVGDSNLQVYQYANADLRNTGQHAGFNAHLAKELGMPLSLMAVGGFKLSDLNRERRLFEGRRVVLYVGAGRLVSNLPWPPIVIK